MVKKQLTSIEQIKNCINTYESFVLQGGAGSGKTETLKETIEYTLSISSNKILCITHTNAAVNEVKKRVKGNYDIYTIHSFLQELISNFKINIKEELVEINKLTKMPSIDRERLEKEDNDYLKKRFESFKKYRDDYNSQLFNQQGILLKTVSNKRTYDESYINNSNIYSKYDKELNKEIDQLNVKIEKKIKVNSAKSVHYNNNKFDNIENMAYGHDSLLFIASNLIYKYPKLQKILQHKYAYIFIDEYQDTNPDVLNTFIDKFISKKNMLGLFGDSMQAIYDDGIGDVQEQIAKGKLKEIQKEDNYRSSYEVVDFINQIRTDNLKQEVVLKEKETAQNRKGKVEFHYIIKFFERNEQEEKKELWSNFKQSVLRDKENFTQLELSNSAIANEMGYATLYSKYKSLSDVNDAITDDLIKLHLKELYEILSAFKQLNYNLVIEKLTYNGWKLKRMSDKKRIIQALNNFFETDLSVEAALKNAFKEKILKKSDSYITMQNSIEKFFEKLRITKNFIEFKRLFNEGNNTFNRIKSKSKIINSQEEFNKYKRYLDKETRYIYLKSESFKLKEVFNYFDYYFDKSKISTMHKTKGEGIDHVAIILDNHQWNKYNFDKMFDDAYENASVKKRTQKLFYVACSRAIKDLYVLKIMKNETELKFFQDKFPSEVFVERRLEEI